MMTLLNSKEHTLEEFVEIGEEAGLSFVKLWDLWDLGELSVVEFRLDSAARGD